MCFLYLLENKGKGNSLYVGVTDNLPRRLEGHNLGRNKSTKAKRPLRLIYFEAYKTRSEAMKREYYFKRDYGGVRLKKEIAETARKMRNRV
jgi:putative endonuclease